MNQPKWKFTSRQTVVSGIGIGMADLEMGGAGQPKMHSIALKHIELLIEH